MKARHPGDIHPRVRMAGNAGLGGRLGGMERRQMTGQTLQLGANDMNVMSRCFGDLHPLPRLAEVAFLTHRPIELRVRRNLFDVRGRPTPDDPRPVLDTLLMAGLAWNLLMRAGLPGCPRGFHDMAGRAEFWIVLDIIVGPVTGHGGSHNDERR